MPGSKVGRRRRYRPLADYTFGVLRTIEGATLGRESVTLETALGRPATPRDWRSAETLVARGLVQASEGRLRLSAAGARVLGRIP